MTLQGIVTVRRVAAAGLLGASLFAVAASAQAPASPGPPPRDRVQSHQAMFALRMAERLAGLQVYLGITPAELPQWNAFTAAG
jgi:hypothetical protein